MRDSYLIYILSSSFAVAVLTLLPTLLNDPTLKTSHYWNDSFQSILYSIVFIFAFFTFVYMAYVGGFFIEQQRQEFKTYRKLGMTRFAIAVLGFAKTLVVQLIAWIIGMIVAIILQKFVGMVLVYMMRIRMDFNFYFSTNILWVMVLVGINSTLILSLINGIRSYWIVRNDHKKKRFHLNWFVKSLLGIVGVILFFIGLIFSFQTLGAVTDTDNVDRALMKALLASFLYLIGTYFIFIGFLPLLLQIFDKTKTFAYRGINLFSFKYLRNRLVKNTSIIWFVTELSAAALALLVFCYAGYQVIYQNYRGTYPFELAATSGTAGSIQSELGKKNTNVKMEYHSEVKRTVSEVWDYSSRKYEPRMIPMMSYSDYSKLPDRITSQNPSISSNDFLEIKNDFASLTPGYRSTKYPIKVKGAKQIKDRKVGSFFPYGTRMFNGFMMIVPDSYYQAVKGEVNETFYGWDVKGSDKLSEKYIKKLDKSHDDYWITVHVGKNLNDSYLTKRANDNKVDRGTNEFLQEPYIRQADAKHFITQATGFFLFIISIFSIALLIALGSLLTLKVLLRDDYEWRQLQTLKKIGVTEDELKKIIKRESRFIFGLPIIFALIQSFVVVGILNLSVNQPTFIPFALIGISYIVLYGLTGFLTYVLSWRGVRQKIQNSSDR